MTTHRRWNYLRASSCGAVVSVIAVLQPYGAVPLFSPTQPDDSPAWRMRKLPVSSIQVALRNVCRYPTTVVSIRGCIVIGVILSLLVAKGYAQDTLYVFNLDSCLQDNPKCYTNDGQNTSAYGYDFMKMAVVFQGIVNRDSLGNKIFYICDYTKEPSKPANFKPDEFWLNYLSQPGRYLSGYTQVRISPDSFYSELLPRFKDMVKGLVLWSDSIPATSNVASTICGVDDYLPAPKGGELDSELVEQLGKLPEIDLAAEFAPNYTTIPGTDIPATGSKKCDVYLWAMENYINTGEVNPTCAYYTVDAYSTLRDQNNQIMYKKLLDKRGLINADYYVANRAFFVDLDPRSTNVPNDDPDQPLGTDYRTFQEILSALRAKADTSVITIGGFVPWQYKYTNGNTGDAVNAEWSTVNLLSSYYAQIDGGTGGPANASIYQYIPLDRNLIQSNDKAQNTVVYSSDTNYVCFYMGDYDGGASISDVLPAFWNSSGRGQIPLAWGIDPAPAKRVPQAFNYLYETAGKNDCFVSGDNGTGYLNSIELPEKYLSYWFNYEQKSFERFDLSIAGFVITGFSNSLPLALEEDYSEFAPNGVGVDTKGDELLINGVPFITVHDLDTGASPTASQVEVALYKLCSGDGTGIVRFVRTISANPAALASGVALLNKDYPAIHLKVIDPYTAFGFFKPVTGVLSPNTVNKVPKSFRMLQNYPNPFNPSTIIQYDLPKSQMVTLKIYNDLGQEVATIVNGRENAGHYEVNFNTNRLASGVYFYVLRTQDFRSAHKMLLLNSEK